MIRFQPDTLRDALWRPLAMAVPDAGVYTEIMAPDLRFAMLLALTVLVAAVGFYRRQRPGTLAALLAFAWLAFIPWLATTGNGRYFMVVLLLVGPLCIALVHRLPVTRNARIAFCIILISMQALAVIEAEPRRRWALYPWGEPYLDVALTPADRDQAAAWVLISGISYSLVAPQFHPESRWINLAYLSGGASNSPEERLAKARIAQAQGEGLPLKLLVPTQPVYAGPTGLPTEALRIEVNRRLEPHRLELLGSCDIRASKVLAMKVSVDDSRVPPGRPEHAGFWVCPLTYLVQAPPQPTSTSEFDEVDRVFGQIERQCPRLFPPGSARTVRMQDGYKRGYPGTDFNAYVLDNGEVLYKYWRALNPNRVGTREQVMAPNFLMDCNQVHGRSGLPWERKL